MTPAEWEEKRWHPLMAHLIRDGKVLQGKRGWLFLANDSNDVITRWP